MTTTQSAAVEAMVAHHAALEDGVARRVAAVRASAGRSSAHGPATAALVAYVADEVLPHAVAEEHTIYRAAASVAELAETVAGMVGEHRRLASLVDRLATASDGPGAVAEAEALGALFASHVAGENERILPRLASDPTMDLAGLLARLQRFTEAPPSGTETSDELVARDVETLLVGVVLDATRRLADAGGADDACRLAAEAWAAVRVPRPDLASEVTVALHRLVRSATARPVAFASGERPAGSDADPVLDVRALAPARRHEVIFDSYGTLRPCTGFVLVNDHDPKPLRYQFEAEHAGAYTWDVLEAGPSTWRVRIGRPAAAV